MDSQNSEEMKHSEKGSPNWPEYPLVYPNGVVTPYHSPYRALYPHGEQSPYEKNPVPPSPPFLNGPFTETCPPNMNWMRGNNEVRSSRYWTTPNETTTRSQEIQVYTNVYDHSTALRDNTGIAPASNVYSGVIKHSRFDFITEEPQMKRSKKGIDSSLIEDTPGHRGYLTKNRNVDVTDKETIDVTRTQQYSMTVSNNLTGSHDIEKHGNPYENKKPASNQPTTPSGQLYSTDDNQLTVGSSTLSLPSMDGADHFTSVYSKLQYSRPGQSHHQERTPYESATPLETYVNERPTTDRNGPVPYTQSTPLLPTINSFTAAFDQYGYRGMTCFPLMYTALPPYLQYYPMFQNTDPYYLLRDRYKDKDPTMFPSFIQPKPSPNSVAQPPMSNTTTFPLTSLLPPFIGSSSSPSRSDATAGIVRNSTEYRHFNIQPKLSSHASWLKSDTPYNYTVAAPPSEVMTYLPQTASQECDKDETDDDFLEDSEEPCYSLAELARKQRTKKTAPPRKPHVCDICGKTYARAFTLKTHKRVHTGERPYKCDICLKTFAQGGGLDSHMRVHTGDKPYQCPVCYRAFSHSSAVKSHLRRHTGEKPFQCRVCKKRFSDQSTLKKHNRIHTGEKPFKCHICKVPFTQVGNMNKHIRNIHGNDE